MTFPWKLMIDTDTKSVTIIIQPCSIIRPLADNRLTTAYHTKMLVVLINDDYNNMAWNHIKRILLPVI